MNRLSGLLMLIEVVERGDYSRAARNLGISPSAVSKAVKRLEEQLGARLFERTSRKMQLTSDGELLYVNCKRAIEMLDEAQASISGSLLTASGDLRILVPPSFAIYQLARHVREFTELYREVRLEFVLSNEILDMAEHRIDVTIMAGQPQDSDLLVRKIATSRWIICASADYLERRGTPQTIADLRQHDCIGFALDSGRNSWVQPGGLEASALLPANAHVAANNASMLQAMARVGCGIVRLAEYHIAADLLAGRLVRLLPDITEAEESVYAIYPRKLRNSAKLRAFVEFIQRKFASPGWMA